MKFSHIADCHLGSWRQPELQMLNLESFRKAIDMSIKEKVDFILISGDLFDSSYPPIEILAEAFSEFKKLREAEIPCFIISGSHDYSVSGKTFLTVLEKAGFCKSCYLPESRDDKIILNPVIYKQVAIYGYPGKKSSLEIQELRNVKIQDAPGLFKILALHTSIKDAVKNLPIDSINEQDLPKADYYALGHLHIHYSKNNFVYSGPIFPNNFQELEELKYGGFCIVKTEPFRVERILLKIKDVEYIELEINNALTATEKILRLIDSRDVRDKIVLLKIHGILKTGKISDIDFKEIENHIKRKEGYVLLRNISKLEAEESEIKIEVEDMNKLEEEILKKYKLTNNKFQDLVPQLLHSLDMEKNEGETNTIFSNRLFQDINKILKLEEK